jgi:hypothetical protein
MTITYETPPSPPKPDVVTLTLTRREAEAFSYALSDVLCWASGFRSARENTGMDEGPLGTNELRDLNIKLKGAL